MDERLPAVLSGWSIFMNISLKSISMALSPEQLDPTNRFTDRVDNYVKYRPTYPPEAIRFLKEHFSLNQTSVVADIGSGTGILTGLLLGAGLRVIAVEPNAAMRGAAEKVLDTHLLFTSNDGKAESTGLRDRSVDLITVAQAFHWMEPVATKKEFARILRRGGNIALIWNLRRTNTEFLAALDQIKKENGQSHNNGQRANEETIQQFFSPKQMKVERFVQEESHDFESLQGQVLSSSYLPLPGAAGFEKMITALHNLFDRYQENGRVIVSYETRIYYPV